MTRRFYVASRISGLRAELEGSEARHLAQVLRARPGDCVTLFDGSGYEFDARLAQVRRERAQLEILASRVVDRELPHPLTLGVALPKGPRQGWLVEKCVELGVTSLVPLRTARGVAEASERSLIRLRRAVIEASKQCGRNRLMEIAPPRGLAEFFETQPADARGWIAHPAPGALPLGNRLAELQAQPVFVAVGPEGGFAPEEIPPSGEGSLLSLGPRILRIETAACLIAAAIGTAWNRP